MKRLVVTMLSIAMLLGVWAAGAPPCYAEPTVTIHDVEPHTGLDPHGRMWASVNKAEKDKGACDEVIEAEAPACTRGGAWRWPPTPDHIWLDNGGWVQATATQNACTVYIQFPYSDENDGTAQVYVDDVLAASVNTWMRGWWFLEIGNLASAKHKVKVVAIGDVHIDYFGFGGTFLHPSVSPASSEAGQTVTLNARLTRDGSVVQGKIITFYKDDGDYVFNAADVAVAVTGPTDANGDASATWAPSVAGAYWLWAQYAGDDTNKAVVNDRCTIVPDRVTLDVVWGNAANVAVAPASAVNQVGTQHTVTATVTNAYGVAIPGRAVIWSIQSGPGEVVSSQAKTDANGQATGTITSKEAGQTVVRVTAGEVFGEATKTWSPLPIVIDIKPGSFPNSINLGSKGVVPVAVLDAATVDPATVVFAGVAPLRFAVEDVNGDGVKDLIFHFDTEKLNLTASSTEATLSGKNKDGLSVAGTDSVRIVPPKGKK